MHPWTWGRTVKVAGLSSWWLVGILHRTAIAQPPPAPHADADLSRRLDTLVETLDKKREQYHIPGMAIAVVKDDKVVLARGLGVRDVEGSVPADEKTLFAIGSSTKAFTSALCAMLVDEGKLAWDDPVRTRFPIFKLSDAQASEQATIRDVLCHRTGPGRTDLLWASGTATREQVYEGLGRAIPKNKFREKWDYNNVTYAAAGFAAANVAGTDWESLVKARIFVPLGMTSTNTSIDEMKKSPSAAKGYSWDDDEKKFTFRPMRNVVLCSPAGAINSNVLDMSRWVRMQLGHGTFEGKKLVSKEALETTWTKQIDMAPSMGYGMGWMLHEWNGKRVVEHGGNVDGFAAEVGMLPDENAGFVLLMNVSASPLQSEAQGIVWQAVAPPPASDIPGAVSADKLGEYVGEYHFALLGVDVKALVKEGKLCLDVPGQMVFELKWPDQKGKWVFAMTDAIAASFERDDKGAITSLTMYQAGLEFELPRKGVKVNAPYSEGELARYCGTYHFEGAGRVEDWKVFTRDGRLVVDIPKQLAFTLRWPDDKGVWVFQEKKDISVEFEKGADGSIASLTIHQTGVPDFKLPHTVSAQGGAALPTLDVLMDKRRASGAGAAGAGVVRMTGTLDFPSQGVRGTVSLIFAPETRFSQAMDFPPFGYIHAACDGTHAWADSIGEEYHEVSGAKRDELMRQGPAKWWTDIRASYDTAEVTGEETVDGARAIVVKASKKNGKTSTRALLSPETGMPLREETTTEIPGIGSLPVTFTYSDYRDVAGMKVPFRVVIHNEFNGDLVIAYEKAETGVSVAGDAFVLKKAR